MPIDRAATLRNAEKLLRQGKLDQAVAEYVRIVEDQPRDWNTANVLGDLYLRAGQSEKAVEQFVRIADHLSEEGFLPKAAAVYKKILKIKPDHEHAMLQAADIAASQGLLVEARNGFRAIAERRRSQNDQRGMAQIRIRVASLDPSDYEARLDGARARAELGEGQAAVNELKQIAADLVEKGREGEATEVVREAAALDPRDQELRERLLSIHIAAGDFERARECATSVEEFKALAAALDAGGHPEQALSALVEASRLDPSDGALKEQLARAFVARGDVESAALFLTEETAGGDPDLLLMLADLRFRSGSLDQGVEILKRLLADDPSRRESIALLGWKIAEREPGVGYPIVELAAETAVEQGDWAGAAAALQEFVTRVPNHIPALMRLVEICVDGGLEATMYSAQAQLADAYIAAGAAAEARFIAEDLVAREPWERSNVERFRQALVLLGEADPDAVIAERLSGQSPFMSIDLGMADLDADAFAGVVETPPVPIVPEEEPRTAAAAPAAASVTATPAATTSRAMRHDEAADASLEAALRELEQSATKPAAAHEPAQEFGEIDLSVALDDFSTGSPMAQAAKIEASDIEGVFDQLRGEAAQRAADAEADYARALALREAGRIEEAIAALRSASRAPQMRFRAALLLGRIYRAEKALPQAIEWLERAVQAQPPTPHEAHLLLYELADALESGGETARALAVCLELQADVGDFKDLAARIDRLSKVQARG